MVPLFVSCQNSPSPTLFTLAFLFPLLQLRCHLCPLFPLCPLCHPIRKRLLQTGRAVDPDCAFWVEGDHVNLDLETAVRPDALKWVDALTKLLVVFKTSPHLL